MTDLDWLDSLIEHEIAYAEMAAQCERTEHACFLYAPDLPDYLDANRAIRPRTAGRSPEFVAAAIVAYYRDRGLPPVADLDPIAESEGIGIALQQVGVQPTTGDRILMHYGSRERPPAPLSPIVIEEIPNETGQGEAAEWIETAVADDLGWPEEALWRAVADCESRYAACRLYLARVNARPAGVCDLFEKNGWGRVESVVTRPEFRRRGIATALATHAVSHSLTRGNVETYLFTETGSPAERLYRRLGFVPWHRNLFRQYKG